MWLRLLLTALNISLVLSSLYVRPLPSGYGISGKEDRRLTDIKDMATCADQWHENPPKVAVFYENSKTCVGYKDVWGRGDADPSAQAYILTPGSRSSDMCPISAVEDFHKMVDCKPGYTKVIQDYSKKISCFYLVKGYTTMENLELRDFVERGCDGYGTPASIESPEVEDGLTKEMYDEICDESPYGLRCNAFIGLVPSEEGYKWIDGSRLDYSRVGGSEPCTEDRCSMVFIAWYTYLRSVQTWHTDNIATNPNLLCKYDPETFSDMTAD